MKSVAVYGSDASNAHACKVGLASFDDQSNVISLCEFFETTNDRLPTLESILLQLQPSAIAVCCNSKLLLKRMTGIASTLCADVKVTDICSDAAEADMARLAIGGDLTRYTAILKEEHSVKAFSVLAYQFRLLADTSLYRGCDFQALPVDGVYMRLDRACFTALNILPPTPSESRKNTSLYGLLNKCRSPGGQKKLMVWLRQPLVTLSTISTRHDIVDCLLEGEAVRQKLQTEVLSKVVDLEKIKTKLRRAEAEKTTGGVQLEDLVGVYEAVVAAQTLIELLEKLQSSIHYTTIQEELVSPLRELVQSFEGFMRLIETCLDMKEASLGKYLISRSFDTQLAELAEKKEVIEAKMEKVRSSIAKKTGIDSVKIAEAQTPYMLAFRVVKRYQQDILSCTDKSIKQVQLNKAEYLFTTPELMDLVASLKSVEGAYNDASTAVIAKTVSVASTYHPIVSRLSDLLSTIDVLAAFALSASIWKLVRPIVSEDCMQMEGARHVLIEARQIETGYKQQFIPNDVCIDKESNLQIITGPNMGGKSTYIRTAALCALMNQIGSFVPCKTARLPVFSNIFCRVGACDEQLRGVSTFMQEMLEAACIVKTADTKSLVIIDELGRGTSTSEGFGLAWAIAKDLQQRIGCFTFFATHYLELSKIPGAVNRHATAFIKDEDITFLYEIKDGVAEKSYGTHVAKLAGYPLAVINAAEDRLSKRQKVIS